MAEQSAALETKTITLIASADTYVLSTAPTTRFSLSPTLELDRSPEAEAYFKFFVAPLQGTLTSARLRVFALDGSVDGPTVHDPPGVHTWNGLTTWETRPDLGANWPVVSVGKVVSGTWIEFDLSDMYFSQNAFTDIFLKADSTDGVTLASLEYPDEALRPRLVLTVESATDHPPPRPPPLTVSSGPLEFSPTADAFVAEDDPGSSGGTAALLRVGDSPRREAHLRFSVQGLSESVQRAVLRLYTGGDGTNGGPTVHQTEGPWSESTLTWSGRPSKVGAALDRSQVVAPGSYVDFDVTDRVRSNGDFAFGVYPASSDEVVFHSREGASQSQRPRLLVWTGAAREAPTDACLSRREVVTRALLPRQDTFVTEAEPTSRSQHDASMRVDSSPRTQAYLDFDVELGPEPVRRVLLRLYALDATGNGPKLFRTESFDASTMEWGTRPAVMGGAIADLGAVARDQWVELDVTDVVTTSGLYSFTLSPDSTDGLRFASSEAEGKGLLAAAPRLVIVTEGAPACSYRGTQPSGRVTWMRQSEDLLAERLVDTAPAPGGGFASLSAVEQTQDAPYWTEQTEVVALHRADGSTVWSRSFAQPDVRLAKVVVTTLGNVLVAGEYSGAPDLGKGPLPQGTGMFVLKLTPAGAVDWARGFTARTDHPDWPDGVPMQVLDLATDAHGSAVVTGTFWGYTDFGAGRVDSGKPYPYDDVYPNSFLLKLVWDGSLGWARALAAETLRGTEAIEVEVDGQENVTVAGWAGRATDFGAGAIAESGLFVARWSPVGTYLWERVIPVRYSDLVGLTLLPDGAAVLTANYGGRITFAGRDYASRYPDDYEGGPRSHVLASLSATGQDVALRQFDDFAVRGLVTDAQGQLVVATQGDATALGLGQVGHPAGSGLGLAGFTSGLEPRWVRVFDALETELELSAVDGGVIAATHFTRTFDLDGHWFVPRSRRSDLLFLQVVP
ncbi:DNRLRE domain-containing protein [Myxococcus stipitatus]|uniref:CBM96 family carbohydrate-binding protein n=1 Tax=Myxococcus stipitatus TaxID=83455 RepID=UPI001F377002|nr:DNRLRE domain-containing protein [Myxococcus stipitatus]MCE9671478.1 DNRLRE domain-containing protein [Myxococcus stipitatus]